MGCGVAKGEKRIETLKNQIYRFDAEMKQKYDEIRYYSLAIMLANFSLSYKLLLEKVGDLSQEEPDREELDNSVDVLTKLEDLNNKTDLYTMYSDHEEKSVTNKRIDLSKLFINKKLEHKNIQQTLKTQNPKIEENEEIIQRIVEEINEKKKRTLQNESLLQKTREIQRQIDMANHILALKDKEPQIFFEQRNSLSRRSEILDEENQRMSTELEERRQSLK